MQRTDLDEAQNPRPIKTARTGRRTNFSFTPAYFISHVVETRLLQRSARCMDLLWDRIINDTLSSTGGKSADRISGRVFQGWHRPHVFPGVLSWAEGGHWERGWGSRDRRSRRTPPTKPVYVF